MGDYDALVVRSETKVTAEVIAKGAQLKVIARAGIGVDNIDLETATSAGIAVVNAPAGNTVAAAEHTLALMLALSRNIPDANQSVKGGQWRRSAFMGVEVRNKTLGIAGLGRVGTEVARRAQGFGMRLLDMTFHPAGLCSTARRRDDVLGRHAGPVRLYYRPHSSHRQHLPPYRPAPVRLGQTGSALDQRSPGELIDQDALLEALDSGRLDGAALDVFAQEPPGDDPLLSHPKVVATPHLGASTEEAQREVALEAAEQVLAVLDGEPARNTVNAPSWPPTLTLPWRPIFNPPMSWANC